MRRKSYPVCAKCDAVLNPNLWDDSEKYYMVDGKVYCKDCFKDYLEDLIETDLDLVATSLGFSVVEV